MSSKYNHFLLSACLPVIAATICVPTTSAIAGFEWTPPEETQAVPLPLETKEPIAPETVISEPLPELIITEEISEPAIQIKVLDDDADIDKAIDDAIENAVEMNDDTINDDTDDIITIELEDEIEIIETMTNNEPEITEITEMETIKIETKETPDAPTIDITADVQEEKEDISPTSSLSINPYPMENATKVETKISVVLPSDSNKKLDDLTAEDVTLTTAETEKLPKETQEKIFWNETETFDVIEGFGTDIPLALALRQIVPAQYAFSFGTDVNPGTTISWTGGQPWNSVLEMALTPRNIAFKLEGKKLILRSVEATPAPVSNHTQSEEPTSISTDDTIESVMDAVIIEESKNDTPVIEKIEIIITDTPDTDHEQSAHISIPAQDLQNDSPKEAIETAEITNIETKASTRPLDIVETVEEATIIEELIAPAEETPKTEKTVTNDVSIKRNNIQDPGQSETKQPILMEQPEATELLEEKKNEVTLSDTASPSAKSNIDYTKQALKQIAAQEILIVEIPTITQNKAGDKATDIASEEQPTQEKAEGIASEEQPTEDEAKALLLDNIKPAEATAKEIPPLSDFRAEPSNTIQIWEANRKSNLYRTLKKWSEKENIELIWDASENYTLNKDVFISGTFQSAIDILFSKGLKNPPKYSLAQTKPYRLHIKDNQ